MPSIQSKAINREYDQMVHDWMLGPMPEAKHAIKEIVETISSDGRQ